LRARNGAAQDRTLGAQQLDHVLEVRSVSRPGAQALRTLAESASVDSPIGARRPGERASAEAPEEC
jgi:hypothetical protein